MLLLAFHDLAEGVSDLTDLRVGRGVCAVFVKHEPLVVHFLGHGTRSRRLAEGRQPVGRIDVSFADGDTCVAQCAGYDLTVTVDLDGDGVVDVLAVLAHGRRRDAGDTLDLFDDGLCDLDTFADDLASLAQLAEPDGCGDLGHPKIETHARSEEHMSELQSRENLVCRLLLEKKKN